MFIDRISNVTGGDGGEGIKKVAQEILRHRRIERLSYGLFGGFATVGQVSYRCCDEHGGERSDNHTEYHGECE